MPENINIQSSLDRMNDIIDAFRKRILKYNSIGNQRKYEYDYNKETAG